MSPPSTTHLPETWRVHLPVFEGPLDLLLHLIRVNQVDITNIPIALICDQFNEYLHLMESLDLDIAGDYVAEAAQLIQIKSKMLLPRPAVGPDGEPSGEEDPRADLVQRLLEYRRLKDAAQALAEVDRVQQGIWTRRERWRPAPVEGDDPAAVEVDLGEVSLFDLMGAFRQALRRYEVEHPEPVLLRGDQFPVRGQVERLLAALDPARPFDLIADLRARSGRAEVISTFLAMLELTRLNLVRLHQTAAGEILLYRTTRELGAAELEALPG